MPMHVGGLHLFEKPDGAGRELRPRDVRADAGRRRDRAAVPQAPPPLAARPARSWCGRRTSEFDIEHHVRHSALPKPGRVRELLDLCSRLHGTRLALGAAAVGGARHRGARATAGWRCTPRSTTPSSTASRRCGCCRACSAPTRTSATCRPPWGKRQASRPREQGPSDGGLSSTCRSSALRTALGITAEAAGMPGALIRTLTKSVRNETSSLSLVRPAHHVQPDDHRLAPVRGPGLADRAAARRSARPPAPR